MSKKKASVNKQSRPQNNPIYFSVVNIELLEKYFLEGFEPQKGTNIKVNLSANLSSDNVKSYLLVTIKCSFLLDDESVIFSMTVRNDYYIPNLKEYIINNKFSDKGFIEYIADMSLSHMRGVQSTLIKGKSVDRLYVPVLQLDGISNEIIK